MGKIKKPRPPTTWTLEKLKKVARGYKTRTEMKDHHSGAYKAACKLGVLEEIFPHCPGQKVIYPFLTKKEVIKVAKDFQRKKQFAIAYPQHYRWACDHGILKEALGHMIQVGEPGRVPPSKWTEETLTKKAKEYKKRSEFSKRAPGAYEAAGKMKILDKICSHMKYGNEIKWTKENVIKEAKKYKNKEEFERKAGGAHHTAYDKGWAEEACSHMPTFSEQITKWTPEKIAKEASKYNTRIDFSHYSPGAYGAAKKKGIIDKVCSHMERLSKRLEELILHPKIEKIIQDNSFVKKQTYFRHLRVAREIPDFILITDKYVIIIEAKTCATHPNVGTYSLYTCQVEKQVKAIKEDQRFIEKKVLHFLVSELGSVKANKTDLNMSLKDLKIALKLCKKDVSKRELIKIIKKSRIKKSINQIKRDHYKESLKIRQDFNNRFEPIKMK